MGNVPGDAPMAFVKINSFYQYSRRSGPDPEWAFATIADQRCLRIKLVLRLLRRRNPPVGLDRILVAFDMSRARLMWFAKGTRVKKNKVSPGDPHAVEPPGRDGRMLRWAGLAHGAAGRALSGGRRAGM